MRPRHKAAENLLSKLKPMPNNPRFNEAAA